MQSEFWIERWRRGEIGFHQADVHDFLAAHWQRLNPVKCSAVLVPLCGKSRDMVFLADVGWRVIGVELAEEAVDGFFAEREMVPDVRSVGNFVVKSAGPYELWCGDFLALPPEAAHDVTAIYDRAALVALPAHLREGYAAKVAELGGAAPMMIISLAFPEGDQAGPPFSIPLAEIAHLYGRNYRITLLEQRDALEKSQNLRARADKVEEIAFLLSPL